MMCVYTSLGGLYICHDEDWTHNHNLDIHTHLSPELNISENDFIHINVEVVVVVVVVVVVIVVITNYRKIIYTYIYHMMKIGHIITILTSPDLNISENDFIHKSIISELFFELHMF